VRIATGLSTRLAILLIALLLVTCTDRRVEPPAEEADLVVYSSHPADLIKTVLDEFRERTGLRVRVVADGTGALLARLRRDGGRGADVLWGGGAESLVANIDLFAAYQSTERSAIPSGLRDAQGYWTGFTVLPMVIIVNSRLVAAGHTPRRWSDLADPALAGSVAFADPASSGSSYTILRTMLMAAGASKNPERAWSLINGFVTSIGGTPLAESALVYRSVAAGEYLVGATYENAGADAQRLGSDVRIVYPADGTSAVPDGVAILKERAHDEAARRFVDFVLGPDVARVVSARFKRRSARTDAPVPEGLRSLDSIPLLDYDFNAAVQERDSTIQRFAALVSAHR